jgi:hypothetical protein
MPEFDDRLDDRLRAALGELGEHAQAGLRPPGSGRIPVVARRRRYAAAAGGAAVLLAVAATVWAGIRPGPPPDAQPAAPVCAPVQGRAFLPQDATTKETEQVGLELGRSPEILAYGFETKDEAWARFQAQFTDAPDLVAATKPEALPTSWWFQLRCAADFPAVQARLAPLADTVTCQCGPADDPLASPVPTPPVSLPAPPVGTPTRSPIGTLTGSPTGSPPASPGVSLGGTTPPNSPDASLGS